MFLQNSFLLCLYAGQTGPFHERLTDFFLLLLLVSFVTVVFVRPFSREYVLITLVIRLTLQADTYCK